MWGTERGTIAAQNRNSGSGLSLGERDRRSYLEIGVGSWRFGVGNRSLQLVARPAGASSFPGISVLWPCRTGVAEGVVGRRDNS